MGEVRALARQHTTAAIAALVDILKTEGWRTARARVAAAEELLDRGWGKSTQPVEATQQITVEMLSTLSRDELLALRALVNRLPARAAPALPFSVRVLEAAGRGHQEPEPSEETEQASSLDIVGTPEGTEPLAS